MFEKLSPSSSIVPVGEDEQEGFEGIPSVLAANRTLLTD
jgi:hypothetical protein